TIQLNGHPGTIKAGDIVLTQAGITFPDGTAQATATQRGPAGPQGPAGPPGSLPSQVVIFVDAVGGGAIRLLGPAGSSTVGLASNTSDPNSGVIAVTDAAGAAAGQARAS